MAFLLGRTSQSFLYTLCRVGLTHSGVCVLFSKKLYIRPQKLLNLHFKDQSSRMFSCTSINSTSKEQKTKPNKTKETIKILHKIKEFPLKENIYTLPNLLTLSRLIAGPIIGSFILKEEYKIALGIFIFAGFTDLLDGVIARRYNMRTMLGTVMDPAADKTLMTVMTITLAMKDLLPFPLAAVILGRDAGLVLASFYYRYISLPPPKTLSRYFDFSIPSAEVRPTFISKINTVLQLALVGVTVACPVLEWNHAPALTALQYTVAGTTVLSGLSYVFSKDAVRILKRPSPSSR
ncbi:7286_t:CDS:2 [Ambispora gerdemannii]|uniref:7286_t:CDS:1 n=1 Tax=Ambispora gerdemannii TaxID=144530 RepID=A0A9N8ZH65_9GLOM|nr:7286_t:CDS:2 [Ambispora gerdemannii]